MQKSNQTLHKILVIRNDKLGDFILAFPCFKKVREILDKPEIHALVPEYTKTIAENTPWIDKIIIDPGKDAGFQQNLTLLRKIKAENYDAVITLFSTTRIGLITKLAGIPYRLAPATKLAQIFYNQRLVQRRSRSLKPEYEYNLDLVYRFFDDFNIQYNKETQGPYLDFDNQAVADIRNQFYRKNNIADTDRFIIVHPGTGGSATNLSLQQYADLITALDLPDNYFVVITAGPGEQQTAEQLSVLLNNETRHLVYHSTDGLVAFSMFIQSCELFISASTGPLHIAGALNRPTAAFYQRRRSATPLRWQTLNTEDRRLAFTPPETAEESDLTRIDVMIAAEEIRNKFLLGT